MKEWELKAQQETAYADMFGKASGPNCDTCCNETAAPKRLTLREEAEQRIGYHRDQANKSDMAAAFFRENPIFDEFIRLIRAGVVKI